MDLIYSRPFLSTRKGVANLTHAATLVSIIAIGMAAANLGPRRWYLAGLLLYVVLNAASTLRLLGTLKQLEARTGEDAITLALFDHAVFLQVLGLIAVLSTLLLVS